VSRWTSLWKWGSGNVRRTAMRAFQLAKTADQAYAQHEYETALALYEESLGLFRQAEYWDGVIWIRLKLGSLAHEMQDYAVARTHFEQGVSLARNLKSPLYLGAALNGLAAVAAHQGEYALVNRLCEQNLQMWRDQENEEGLAGTYSVLGSVARDGVEARLHYERALALYRKLDHAAGIAAALCSLGHLAAPGQDNAQERACLEECLEMCLASGDQRTRSYVFNNLGNIERYAGSLDRARELYRESLRLKREIGDDWAIAYTLEGCAALAAARQQGERAARLLGAAAGIRERLGTPLESAKQAEYQADLALARTLLDAATFESAWNEGKALSLAQVLEEAASE
jgi:tetratricopeptide (TPR) repeat protein